MNAITSKHQNFRIFLKNNSQLDGLSTLTFGSQFETREFKRQLLLKNTFDKILDSFFSTSKMNLSAMSNKISQSK